MKYIICDDSDMFIQNLKNCILKIEPNSTFAVFSSLSALKLDIGYIAGSSDAIFLDIRLNDGNGIEAAREIILQHPHLKLVYVTGYGEEYAQSIFENPIAVNPVAFLTKPIQTKYLINALEKIKEPIRETQFVTVRTNRSIMPVPADKVIYISSDKRLLTLHMEENDISFYGKMSDIPDSGVFFRIHKSYKINLNHIETISGWKTVILSDGTDLPIGRSFSALFKTEITGRSINKGDLS